MLDFCIYDSQQNIKIDIFISQGFLIRSFPQKKGADSQENLERKKIDGYSEHLYYRKGYFVTVLSF